MEMTVSEAAEMAGVSEKSIRLWIVQNGLPVLKAGAKGPNQGALIDAARFPGWLEKKRRGGYADCLGDRLQEIDTLPNGGNPFRWLAEYQHGQMLLALGVAWRSFLDDGQYAQWGLTEEQARAVAWRAWGWCAQWTKVYLVDGAFERALEHDTECDLDAFASLLLKSDFQTDWSDLDNIACPPEIAELVPPDVAARLADGDNVRTMPRRRPKKKRRAR
jgi:hypothetical protein